MREFSKVYQNIWTSTKFESLPDDGCRLLYLYILTNQHSNSSGCYNLKEGYALSDLHWSPEAYRKAIDSLSIAYLIDIEDGFPTVLITKWVDFNPPTNAKHAIAILAQLDAAASPRLKHKRGQEFTTIIDAKKFTNDRLAGNNLDTLCIPYRYPIDSLSAPRPRPRLDLDQTLDLEGAGGINGSPVALATLAGGATALTEPTNISSLLQTKFMKKARL